MNVLDRSRAPRLTPEQERVGGLPESKINLMRDERIRKWLETRDRAGPELEALERLELEAMTDPDARAFLHELFTRWSPGDIAVILNSGLVEQQRWFAKAHRKLAAGRA